MKNFNTLVEDEIVKNAQNKDEEELTDGLMGEFMGKLNDLLNNEIYQMLQYSKDIEGIVQDALKPKKRDFNALIFKYHNKFKELRSNSEIFTQRADVIKSIDKTTKELRKLKF